jgi:hypothetical protein
VIYTETVTVGTDGRWYSSHTISLADGSYKISAVQTDSSNGTVTSQLSNVNRFSIVNAPVVLPIWPVSPPSPILTPPIVTPPTTPVGPVTPNVVFTEDHIAYIIGYEDGTFKPDDNISREEVATIFYRLLTDEIRAQYRGYADFTDVDDTRWSSIYIGTLQNLGIFTGYEDGSFKPEEFITRAEIAVIAAKLDANAFGGTTDFSDISGHWAEVYIAAAESGGLLRGYEDGSFNPDAYITRAEAVTLVNRILKRESDISSYRSSAVVDFPDIEGHWAYYQIIEASTPHEYVRRNLDTTDIVEDWTDIG